VGVAVRGVAAAAGVEVGLGYAAGAARFVGVVPSRERVGDLPLGPVEAATGVSWGWAGCRADCGDPGGVVVGTAHLVPQRAGVLLLQVAAVKVVDGAGDVVFAAADLAPRRVQVAGGELPVSGEALAAPVGELGVGPGGAPAQRPAAVGGDASLGPGDGAAAAVGWAGARERGGGCDARRQGAGDDVNRDGCVDVADVQAATVASSTTSMSMMSLSTADASSPDTVSGSSAAVWTVTSAADDADRAVGDGTCASSGGGCTLRAALQEANSRAGDDTVGFAIPGEGPHTIVLGSALPTVSATTGRLTIDGYSQPGSRPNTLAGGSDADIRVQVRGEGPDGFDGLVITSAGNVVRGLSLYDLHHSIRVFGPDAHDNLIAGTFVGTNAAGTFGATTYCCAAHGIHLHGGAADNTVGGTAPADRNVVSGTSVHGVALYDADTDRNRIVGNLVGLSPDGTRKVPNLGHGIDVNTGASDNLIGGTAPGEANVVSGNVSDAIEVSHLTTTRRNQVVGNFVGTDAAGTGTAAHTVNKGTGIHVEDGVKDTTVAHNVVVGNAKGGVQVDGYYTTANTVRDNLVGVLPSGARPGNQLSGIRVTFHAAGNQIGPGNRVEGNPVGVVVNEPADTDRNRITQNSITANTGLGIDLALGGNLGQVNPNDNGDADTGPNEQVNWPEWTVLTATSASGTACPGCLVEVFQSDGNASGFGSGARFVGGATANGDGRFTVPLPSGSSDLPLTATASDPAGNTSEFNNNLRTPRSSGADSPVATFTGSCDGLGCSFDGSGSSDPEGGTLSYAWDFGDGTTGSGPTVAHTYATPGTYRVSLSVSDRSGATGTSSTQVTVGSAATVYAADSFSRTVSGGWGNAETGGAWGPASSRAAVRNGVGTLNNPAGSAVAMTLGGASALDVDASVVTDVSAPATGGGQLASVVVRRVDDRNQYRGRVRRLADGTVRVRIERLVDGRETALTSELVVSGLSGAPGTPIMLRLQAVGANPTALRFRTWDARQPEPQQWQRTASDSSAALQVAGKVGVRTYLPSTATNAPLTTSFDNYRATGLSTTTTVNAPPRPALTGSCDGLGCSFDGSGSSDPEGGTLSYAWDFGDGTTGSGPTVAHTYATPGTYRVSLSVSDRSGATGTSSTQVTVGSAATVYAADSFSRTVSGGWGNAETGGAWGPASSRAAVRNGVGTLNNPAGSAVAMTLGGASALDVDASVVTDVSAPATGGGQLASVVVRRVDDRNQYRGRVRRLADGTVRVRIERLVDGRETALTSELVVSGLSGAPGTPIMLRLQAVGANPTALRFRTWDARQPEPQQWQRTASDSSAALQVAGKVGVRTYLPSTATNAPLTTSFDNYRATSV